MGVEMIYERRCNIRSKEGVKRSIRRTRMRLGWLVSGSVCWDKMG